MGAVSACSFWRELVTIATMCLGRISGGNSDTVLHDVCDHRDVAQVSRINARPVSTNMIDTETFGGPLSDNELRRSMRLHADAANREGTIPVV